MAAIRPALAMLSRRSCGSGSSAAASLGGSRVVEIQQTFHPVAVRSTERWRGFSTVGGQPADKAEGVLRKWWRRAKIRVDNANVAESSRFVLVYSTITLGAATCYMVKSMWDITHRR